MAQMAAPGGPERSRPMATHGRVADMAEANHNSRWHQSALFWGCISAVVAIVIAVVVAMIKDVRWLLFFAWLFAAAAVWEFARTWGSARHVKWITASGSLVAAVALFALYLGLGPEGLSTLATMPDISTWPETRWFWGIFGILFGVSACAWIIRSLPVTASGQPEPLKDWDPRIFHFGTHVTFDRLDEFLIVFDFRFFNGTEYTIVRGDTVIGWIYLYDPSEWIIIRDPRFQNSQSKVHNKPFQPFMIALEQRVTSDQQDAIRRGLDSGQPIRFIFSNLNVQLGSADGEREWHRPRVWDGVTCTKMPDRLVCERICDVSSLRASGN
jgi:hypothetical protein